MKAKAEAIGGEERRLNTYMDSLAQAVGHADRHTPLRHYCTGLLLSGERKSVEPMAARVAPQEVEREHQSLLHFVGQSEWDEEALLDRALETVLPAVERRGPVTAWIVDDTGIPKKGRESVGVAHQYCGQLGKTANCQVAVTLSLATPWASMPVAYQLYLPEAWAEDRERRAKAKVPEAVEFQTKPAIALAQIRRARQRGLPEGVVLADGAYGSNTDFRLALEAMAMRYLVGVVSTVGVWFAGEREHHATLRPLAVKEVALALPAQAWKTVPWREGTRQALASRFAARRVHTAHRGSSQQERWLLIEWPEDEAEPTRYWLSNLPRRTALRRLAAIAKQRWIIERDYEELKQELGLGHFEGRNWRGFHHHAALCIAAYGFLVAERAAFSPSGGSHISLSTPRLPAGFRPRGSPPS